MRSISYSTEDLVQAAASVADQIGVAWQSFYYDVPKHLGLGRVFAFELGEVTCMACYFFLKEAVEVKRTGSDSNNIVLDLLSIGEFKLTDPLKRERVGFNHYVSRSKVESMGLLEPKVPYFQVSFSIKPSDLGNLDFVDAHPEEVYPLEDLDEEIVRAAVNESIRQIVDSEDPKAIQREIKRQLSIVLEEFVRFTKR